ncbi:testis-expressed protein 11 [Rhinatrema bivittatum]|uniref:testis-expressed protein 11 n=1 Tax=Rhinatrema bivittatum TaxID=194408 RepID=UPI00112904CD|nr:testis-expressed protein 11 [Rhinatrema bivittatum]
MDLTGNLEMEQNSCFLELKGLMQDLVKEETLSKVIEIINRLYSQVTFLDKETAMEIQDPEVEEAAINLWNWGVTKRAGAIISDEQQAKLRHIACRLVCACEGTNPTEATVRRQILMTMKTGKGWVDVGKPSLADGFLDIAMKALEKLYVKLTKRNNEDTNMNVHKTDVEKDLFKVLTYQAEAAVAQENFQKAIANIQHCKDILMRLPKETAYLSILCYNFGVETYEHKNYEQSTFWLSQSYEIGKMDKKYATGPEMQAKVLRLLATVYLDWDCKEYQDKALRAICLANEENLHPAGLFLKMKILLKSEASDDAISEAIAELSHHEVSLDFCLNTSKLLLEHGRESEGFQFLKTVCERFESSPDGGKAAVLHIELLLQRGKELLAKQKIEGLITGHYAGKQLSPELLNWLHIIFWDQAAKNFETKMFPEALHWYNYSLSFYSAGQIDPNLAKLQRNRASCHLHLNQLQKAKEAVEEAERCDPRSIFTQFSVYKIATLENNIEKASDALAAMEKLMESTEHNEELLLENGSTKTSLLSLAAQIALENEQQDIAIKALETLVQQSQDLEQVFTSLRCLIRLILSDFGKESEEKRNKSMSLLLTYLNTVHQKLAQPFAEESLSLDKRTSEAHWFRKIAWNLAVQSEEYPRCMRNFFIVSFKLSQFCPVDPSVLVAQKTCLIMATTVDLEMARNASASSEQLDLLTEALEHIRVCKEVWNLLKSSGDFSRDPTDVLLLLYEFEIRAKLNDPTLESLQESVWELPQLDTKTLETIASLAMEPPAHYPSFCKRALQSALSLHKKQEPLDVLRYSKCLHSLVQLSLPTGVVEMESCTLEEVWTYFEEALNIINNSSADYPEVETLWLMTQAWNTGIFLYSTRKYTEAEQWCGLAIRYLSQLGSLKSSYETQMVGLYSEIIEQLDQAKNSVRNEE